MRHLRTRNDLIVWLENNAPSRAIARALQEGQCELLGAFKNIAKPLICGWIVRVTSIHKREWNVVIEPVRKNIYRVWVIEDVPWEKWVGDQSNNPLYQGDNLEKYKELKNDSLL